jgi:N-methylhydantoinase B
LWWPSACFDREVKLCAAVTVNDDSVHVDYAGSSEQVLFSINCRANYRYAHTVYALKCLLDPDTPNNQGCIVPITDEAPRGTILNPFPWAAGNSRNLIGHAIPSLIFKALEAVVPDKVIGDSGGAPIWSINCVGQRDDGTLYGAIQNFHGGLGARPDLDGLDTLSFPSNCKITAVEMFELAVPLITECKQLIPDSGGAGEFRGGLGQRAVVRNLAATPMSVYVASEHVNYPCFGVVEGQAGSAGKVLKNGVPHFPKGKIVLATGDRLAVETPGGGGWGRPERRRQEAVARDLAEGVISRTAAGRLYGLAAAAELERIE